MSLLIYGANGFIGALVSRTAAAYRMPHILAGRNPEAVQHAAAWAKVEGRAFPLDNPEAVAASLTGVKVVINCAGPFSETAIPLAKACMLVGAHYLDLSDRASDHLAMLALEPAAIQAGIMLMPGVGSALMPADCLSKLVIDQIKSPTHLTLAFSTTDKPSIGAVRSLLRGMHEPGVMRRNGTLRPCYPGVESRDFEMKGKTVSTLTDPWRAEQVGVFRSTGIRNIETFTDFSRAARFMLKVPGQAESGAMKWFVERTIRRAPDGPSDKELYKSTTSIYAQAKNKAGETSSLTMVGPGVARLSALTAIACAYEAQSPKLRPGYQTPARAFGSDIISKIEGVEISKSEPRS